MAAGRGRVFLASGSSVVWKEGSLFMPMQLVELRRFGAAELIFDQQETKDILKFFFVADHPRVDGAEVTDELRNPGTRADRRRCGCNLRHGLG